MSARPSIGRLLLGAALLGALGAPAGAQGDDDRDARPFALPMARDARTLAERARDHLRAQRWAEGIAALERLIEEHRGDVLPDDWRESADQYTNYPAHPGAATWAHDTLALLPDEARKVYRERYGARAHAALSGAGRERRALVEVAQRYPFTLAAADAWTALGDLEVESGHVDEAVIAWERARAVHAWNGDAEPSGLAARLALARSLAGPEPAGRAGAEPGPVPRNDADSWPQAVKLDFEPFQRTGVRPYAYNLAPLLTQDRVLVGTTHRLYAIDGFSGERLWEVGPPEGWPRLQRPDQNELFKAIGYEQIAVLPAVGGNIAVTALQIPFSETPNDSWQGIEILAAIPERRLYAYDLETGEELWNHAPPLTWRRGRWEWDGYTGSFPQRMMVASSPVVVGSRVLVPCYRMQGRIEYHVACYDLATGQTLWTTALVSGQRETNMFGRVDEEFVASPLCVSGDRVIAQTELGTVACLDLVTGDIVWEALYKQIPLPKTASYSTPERMAAWRVAPPLVADGLVVSTPSDSKLLLGIDLRDGRVLWSPSRDDLSDLDTQTRNLKYNLLFGADGDTVYLAGEKIGALQRPGGLRGRSQFIVRWTYSLDEDRNTHYLPRPALGRDEVVVPTLPDRLVLDRRTGEVLRQKTASWTPVEAGNVAIGNGMLFSLGRECLTGYFDWEILLERQRERRAERPDDVLVAIDTAELLTRRAHTVHENGEDAVALKHLREAQLLLEPLRTTADVSSLRRVTKSLHEVLRGQALVLSQTDITGALEALEAARALAPTAFALRDTLLDEERLLRDRARQRRIEILDELARSCGDLPLPPEAFDGDLRWLVGESLIDPSTLAGARDSGMSVGLWAVLARAEARARSLDTRGALEELHLALERYGDFELVGGVTVATLAGDRIGRRIELDGPTEYAEFEARARALYDEALAAGDRRLLERVGRLYPHSRAAREALRDRLDLAYRDDQTETVAEIAYAALSLSPEIDPLEVPALLRLASALGRAGNAAFERGLIAWIARVLPDTRSDLPHHGGRLLREIADELLAQTVVGQAPTPRFDHRASFRVDLPGRFELVGTLPLQATSAETAPVTTHVYLADGDALHAFSSDDPGKPAWSAEHLELDTDPERCALSETRIVAAARDRLIALDREGLSVWTRDLGADRQIQSLRSAQGICLAVVGAEGQADTLLAVDAHGGIPLWDLPLPQREGRWDWEPPVSSDGVTVLLARAWGQRSRALVVDAFRGRVISDIVLERGVAKNLDKAMWIEGDLLVVPDFASASAGTSGVSAYDLRSGRRAWATEFPPGEELHSLATHGGKNYLITQIAQIESQARNGGIYALDTTTGGVRTVVPLSAGDEAIGLELNRRTVLETPYLFLRSRRANGRGTPISAVHLPFEKRWVYTLPVDSDEIYDRPMPMPAVSADCVVLAYFTAGKNRVNWQAQLEFIDKNAGTHIENRNLASDLAKAERLELRGLGSALFLVAKGRQSDRLQIWEDVR